MGLPVVGTRLSAIPELIENGKTGLLVEPGNDGQMASAMLRILTDIELRERVILSGRERVQQAFNNRALTQNLFSIYRKEVPALRLK